MPEPVDPIVSVSPSTSVIDWQQVATAHLRRIGELERERDTLQAELRHVEELIDDVLYDPSFKPVDESGNRIHGDEFYLTDHPVMDDHVPALRQWFVRRCRQQRAAEAAELTRPPEPAPRPVMESRK
jgi:hypothetical protein